MRFYWGGKKFTNKNCLFDTKFFEFEVKSYSPFFSSSIHTVYTSNIKKQFWRFRHIFVGFSEYMNFTITLTDFNNFKDETARLEAYVLIFMASHNSQNMQKRTSSKSLCKKAFCLILLYERNRSGQDQSFRLHILSVI